MSTELAGANPALELYNEATPGWERMRTPTKWIPIKAVAVTAGTPVAVWTPASGKSFRILGWTLGISVASGAVYLNDNATNFAVASCSSTAPNEVMAAGNGYLSAAADNPLKLDVAASCTIYGTIWGTEE